jgi:hypothetical protein
MRLQVRDVVREMRDRFKVVEWGYFLRTLRERGLSSVEDISDALHFLTNIGELSYFGNVFPDKQKLETMTMVSLTSTLLLHCLSCALTRPHLHCL